MSDRVHTNIEREGKTMTFTVDNRRAASQQILDHAAAGADPEPLHRVIGAAIEAYVKARCSKDGRGFTIPHHQHAIVEDLSRHVTECLLKNADSRRWDGTLAKDVRTGDVFMRYTFEHGRAEDYEVTVVFAKSTHGKTTIKYRRSDSDKYKDVTMSDEYMLLIHRPEDAPDGVA